jgi:hypothetical protein
MKEMYRYFDSLPHPSCPEELGMVVAKQKSKSLRSQGYPDGRFIRGDRAEIHWDITVRRYEDSRKSSGSGFGAVPETEAVIP